MATQVQFRRGTTAETASFTGASGEITVDLTKHVCVVHDAIQVGGYPLMLESGVNSALSPGTLSNCSLKFLNDPNTGFFSPGPDQLTLVTGGVARITVDSAGAISIPGNFNIGGNFTAGTITATTFVGDLTGNASTVTTNANLTGDITSVGNATAIASGVIVNADINASAAIADTKLATIATASKVSNSATTATSANTASTIVARDGSGNFTAGTITAALTGTASGNARLVSAIALPTASGTSIDFTSIPSWVKKITVMLQEVSTNGNSVPLIQLGDSGGIENTGYTSQCVYVQTVANDTTRSGSSTDGIRLTADAHLASYQLSGNIEIINIYGDVWIVSGIFDVSLAVMTTVGRKTLSTTLDRIRLTTAGGANTFDNGAVNIIYEG